MADSVLTFNFVGNDVSLGRAADAMSKKIDKVGASTRKLGADSTRSSRLMDGIGNVAKKAALGIGALGVAGVGAAVVLGVRTVAANEQAMISYDTLLGSADKAKRHYADLQRFAAATPFELPGLVQADRQLIGAGESADKTIKSLTAWGDASGALGQTQDQFARTMLAVSQAMGAGKVQAGDLLQITEAGIPIWSILSEALGKPVSKLRDLAAKGQLLAADVLPKLEKQMEKKYGGAMEKQAQTLNGLWSTLSDTFTQAVAAGITPLLPALKAVTVELTNQAPKIAVFTKYLADNGTTVGIVAAIIGGTLVAALVAAGIAAVVALSPFVLIAAGLGALGAAAVICYAKFGPFRAVVDALGHAFLIAVGYVRGFAAALVTAFTEPIAFVIGLFGKMASFVGGVLSHIPGMGAAGAALQRLGDNAQNVANDIRSVADAIAGVRSKDVTLSLHVQGIGSVLSAVGAANALRNASLTSVFYPGRAAGGKVTGGGTYLVGENGPELFSPTTSGQIIPNGGAARAMGGGQVTVTLVSAGADDDITRLLRKIVRVNGGDVQAAFGRTA